MAASDIRDGDMESGAVRQGCVNEWRGQVQTASGRLEHFLDDVTDLLLAEGERSELRLASASYIDLRRGVDPDFFDARIIEKRLQGAITGDGIENESTGLLKVAERREHTYK